MTTQELVESEAFKNFLAAAQKVVDAEFAAHYPRVTVPHFETMVGEKYVRIVQADGTSRSAWAFIDTDGNILKPDGWRRPAKHPRGNIHDTNPVAGITRNGPVYLRR